MVGMLKVGRPKASGLAKAFQLDAEVLGAIRFAGFHPAICLNAAATLLDAYNYGSQPPPTPRGAFRAPCEHQKVDLGLAPPKMAIVSMQNQPLTRKSTDPDPEWPSKNGSLVNARFGRGGCRGCRGRAVGARVFGCQCGELPSGVEITVDARNPFRTTFKPWEAIACQYLQANRIIPGFLRWCEKWISSVHGI